MNRQLIHIQVIFENMMKKEVKFNDFIICGREIFLFCRALYSEKCERPTGTFASKINIKALFLVIFGHSRPIA